MTQTAGLKAGIGFDLEEGEEVEDSSSILVVFTNRGKGDPDSLDPDSVGLTDVLVAGNTVADVIHPNRSTRGSNPHKDLAGENIDTRNRLYVVVADELASDEEPKVQIFSGAVRDLAGNANRQLDARAVEGIKPSLAVTVTGDTGASGRTLAESEIDVTITSDERLNGPPGVYFATIRYVPAETEGGATTTEIRAVTSRRPISSDVLNTWSNTYDDDDVVSEGTAKGLIALIVTGTDRARIGNRGRSSGWEGKGNNPVVGDKLRLDKLDAAGLLVEFDSEIDDNPVEEIKPLNEGTTDETDSQHPFIVITFDEASEYTVAEYDRGTPAVQGGDNPATMDIVETDFGAVPAVPPMQVEEEDGVKVATGRVMNVNSDGDNLRVDSHRSITITSIELDGEDVKRRVAQIEPNQFNLTLQDLEIGEHSLVYSAVDEAGNELEGHKFSFEVVDRDAYQIALQPGWNLVSFPGDPVETEIDSVLPADHPAIEVLQFEAGLWAAAVRGPGNVWEGDLTDIDGGHAYWINTTSTAPLSAVLRLPGVGTASRLPSIVIDKGWNLVPVTDLDQAAQPKRSDGVEERGVRLASNYFAGLEWNVGYSYNAETRQWSRLNNSMGSTSVIRNGEGVWVWVSEPGTLVP